MKFDIALPNCMEGFLVPANFAGPAELVRFAQDAERLGYYALWGSTSPPPSPISEAALPTTLSPTGTSL